MLFDVTYPTQSVCGVSVVKDYYKLQKFNVMEVANAKNLKDGNAGGRISEKEKEDVDADSSIEPASTAPEVAT